MSIKHALNSQQQNLCTIIAVGNCHAKLRLVISVKPCSLKYWPCIGSQQQLIKSQADFVVLLQTYLLKLQKDMESFSFHRKVACTHDDERTSKPSTS